MHISPRDTPAARDLREGMHYIWTTPEVRLLTLVFGVMLKWLPVAGWGDGAWQNRILPLVALALPQLAVIARLSRGAFLDVRRQNFIRAARARGLPEWRVVWVHALPPTLVPLVSYLAPAVAGVMTGWAVELAAREAADRGFQVQVASDACPGETYDVHGFVMPQLVGGLIRVRSTEAILDMLEGTRT